MSNRFLGVLIIIGFIGLGYIFYKVEYTQKQEKKHKIIKKSIENNQNNKISAKKAKLIKYIPPSLTLPPREREQNSEKKDNSYFYKFLKGIGNVKFIENKNKLELFVDEKNLGSFLRVEKDDIKIIPIINSTDYFFIILGKNKYFYNLSTRSITDIELNLEVDYIKKGRDSFEFLFKTSVGTFVYSVVENKMEYFSFFNDFVYFFDNKTKRYSYVGVVKKGDKIRFKNLGIGNLISKDNDLSLQGDSSSSKNNLGLISENGDFDSLIVFYNPFSKEKSLLLQTKVDIDKIYTVSNGDETGIFVLDEVGEEYRVGFKGF